MVTHFESIQGVDHMYFGSANDEWFMSLVISQLQVPEQQKPHVKEQLIQ